MIETNFYAAQGTAQSPVFQGKNDPDDAAAAADFARILNAPAAVSAPTPTEEAESGDMSFFGFIKNIIDVINPLQHIPVIGAIYRHMTGDEIGPMARLAGDTLYGGPVGAALALADIATQKATGKDMGENVMAALTGEKDETPAATATAQILNDTISPAAGNTAAVNDIIWSTPYGAAYHEPIEKEQIAARMASALDKYREMKVSSMAPQITGSY